MIKWFLFLSGTVHAVLNKKLLCEDFNEEFGDIVEQVNDPVYDKSSVELLEVCDCCSQLVNQKYGDW